MNQEKLAKVFFFGKYSWFHTTLTLKMLTIPFCQVTDPDNKNGPVQTHACQVLPSADSVYFQVHSSVQLTVKQNMDYETKSTLNISVLCSDSGKPSLSITKSFLFSVAGI